MQKDGEEDWLHEKREQQKKKLAGRKDSLSSNQPLGNDVFRKGLFKDSLHIRADMIDGYLTKPIENER